MPDGTTRRMQRNHKKPIFIGAKNMYEAYVFLYTYLPELVPTRVRYRGSIWIIPQVPGETMSETA